MEKFAETNSVLAQEAAEIIENIKSDVKVNEYKVTPYRPRNPRAVRQYVINRIRGESWRDRIVTAIDGDVLFIKVKNISRVKILEAALEKVLPAIDDELLYEEMMEVLYGNGQK